MDVDLILDGVEDPHNLGAILRTADASGADGLLIPERRAAGITGTVAKSSSGASEYLPVAKVTNIARTLEDLKAKGLWIVGLDERGKQRYDEVDYKMDCAIALGAEGVQWVGDLSGCLAGLPIRASATTPPRAHQRGFRPQHRVRAIATFVYAPTETAAPA